MGWLIAVAVLVLLAIAPLGVSVGYDSDGAVVIVIAGPVRLKVFPLPKKKKKPKEKPAKKKAASKPAAQPTKKEKTGGSITRFLPLVQLLLDMLDDFRRKLRVNRLELNLILGGGDPCDLGEKYGKACAAMGNLWPRLEEFLVIQKRDVKIQCDFEASQTLVTARLDVTITLGRLLGLCLWHGAKILKAFLQITKQEKGGAAL